MRIIILTVVSMLLISGTAIAKPDRIAPTAPTNLVATAGDAQVSLSWGASTDNVGVTGYRVYRGGVQIATTTAAVRTYTNTGLTNGTSYSYTIRAVDAANNVSVNSNTATATPVGSPPPPSDPLVSTGDSATASSQESTSRLPSFAFDQNLTTRWASILDGVGGTGHDPEWIYVDLGASYNVTRVKLNWEAAYGTAYRIETSNDASNWTQIYSTTTGNGGIDDLTNLTGVGRYVRMYGTARSTQWGYSLWEMEVYGTVVQQQQPQCSDGIDNADPEDTLVDYPADLGCTSAADDDETNTTGPTPPPAPGTWNLRVNDEFTSIDPSRWGYKFWWNGDTFWPNKELQVYKPANCTSNGNELLETAIKPGGTITGYNNSTTNSDGEPYQYTSCFMSTGGSNGVPAGYLFTYGYAEARMWVSGGKGVWPGFWSQRRDGTNGQFVDDTEIDILELIGSRPSEANMTFHGPQGASGSVYTCACDLTAGYHTYAIDWEPGSLTWYIDGIARKTLVRSDVPTTPHYLMFNLAVGGANSWPGAPDASTPFPSVTKVDYMRVWQH